MKSKTTRPLFRVSSLAAVLTLSLVTLASAQSTEKIIHLFHGPAVKFPNSGLISDPSGNLFGVTNGAVYELSPTSNGGFTYQVIASMPGGVDDDARGNLVRDPSGKLFGATQGGNINCGYVYQLTPHTGTAWTFEILKTFDCINGGRAGMTMALDSAGNLFGASTAGGTGADASGLVYELSPMTGGNWKYQILHYFKNPEGNPQTGVLLDAAGNVFGATTYNVYKIVHNPDGTWSTRSIHHFDPGVDGYYPLGDLIFDAAGNLYGTNEAGGPFVGTAYKLSPSAGGWILTVLRNFGGADEGCCPFGGLVLDAAGNLYGTTSGGFIHEFGSVFKLSQVGGEWQETILYSFAGVDAGDGAMPETSLFLQSNTLYGTTIVGGDPACRGAGGCGTVFAIR